MAETHVVGREETFSQKEKKQKTNPKCDCEGMGFCIDPQDRERNYGVE